MHANGDCLSGFSDSPNEPTAVGHQQYARRHAPATFYADVAADCTPNGRRHVRDFPLPVGDTGNSSTSLDENRGAFAGMADGWPAFSVIVPDLCHDGHNAIHACDNNGFHALADAGGSPACHSLAGDPPGTGSEDVAKHGTVDCWLQENLRDIAMDVGPNGVVIITTDEGTSGGAQLPMIIVPGQNGNGIASALSCTDGAPCATSTFYDHGSTIRALEDAFAAQDTTGSIGCSRTVRAGGRQFRHRVRLRQLHPRHAAAHRVGLGSRPISGTSMNPARTFGRRFIPKWPISGDLERNVAGQRGGQAPPLPTI